MKQNSFTYSSLAGVQSGAPTVKTTIEVPQKARKRKIISFSCGTGKLLAIANDTPVKKSPLP